MEIPDSPLALVHEVQEARVRETFANYEAFTDPMQMQARLLMKLQSYGELTDVSFRDLLALTLHHWRECNQARFLACKDDHSSDGFHRTVRSVQIDQFVNQTLHALTAIPELLDDEYGLEEPDGS